MSRRGVRNMPTCDGFISRTDVPPMPFQGLFGPRGDIGTIGLLALSWPPFGCVKRGTSVRLDWSANAFDTALR
jgi:hypothetical protein